MVGAPAAEGRGAGERRTDLGEAEDVTVEVARPFEVPHVQHRVSELEGPHRAPTFLAGDDRARSDLDGLDVELHLHLLAHQYTTGLERDVPFDAEVLAVDLGLGAER